jgi:hypothetical protein
MNTLRLMPLLGLIVAVSSCGSNDEKKEQADKAFFPVNAQIIAELKALDSLPLAIFRYRTQGDRSDTIIVSKEVLRDAARYILDADITNGKDRSAYAESVYLDQSINSVTMSYTSKDDDKPVRKVDVYLDPGNDRMRQVYVESTGARMGDSSVLRKMLWSPGHFYQVTTLTGTNKPEARVVVEKYSWESPN